MTCSRFTPPGPPSAARPRTQNPARKETFFIHTFGCQMNENDSERIAGLLAARGLRPSPAAEGADVVIINTCSVRAKSEEKLFSLLGRLGPLKKNRDLRLGVVGCAAQIHGSGLRRRCPEVDFVVGPDNYDRLPDVVADCRSELRLALDRSTEWREAEPRTFLRESPVSGYVTVMEGCDNFCSYCIVPFARGRERFRPRSRILDEVRGLAAAGYREIQLLGQNVNSYRDPESGADFAALLEETAGVTGVEWVRFLTSHPRKFGLSLARTMARLPKVCRQLHLPLQAGSTSVLKRMNRGYSRRDYLDLVLELRALMPDLSLSADIIVGFPGETEEEFRETLTALETVRFANIFSFRYSPRPLTAAARLKDDVPAAVKRRRLIEVQDLQKRIQGELNAAALGTVQKVLCLGRSKKPPRVLSGRNAAAQVVNFSAPAGMDCLGRFVDVRITGSGPYSLRGEVRR
jgi:tRNA-2-methylthio-N6-dimethylallyladenosine synthase